MTALASDSDGVSRGSRTVAFNNSPDNFNCDSADNFNCHVHTWNVENNDNPKAIVIVYHGFRAHGDYPTVKYACRRLAASNYAIFAPDMRGHGKSGGLSMYIPSAETMIKDGITFFNDAMSVYAEQKQLKVFLLGSSMGGTIALSVAHAIMSTKEESTTKNVVSGVVLLAPMLKLSVSTPARYLLYGLSHIVPRLEMIPNSSTSSEKQYRDTEKRKECDNDAPANKDGSTMLRVGSASTCVELAASIQTKFESIDFPFLAMVADEDVIVNNTGTLNLVALAKTSTNEKTLKRYPALHGLLCEPSPLVDQIQDDMIEWIDARV